MAKNKQGIGKNSRDMKKLILEYQSSKQKSSCHLAEGNSSKLNEVGIKPDGFKSYTVCLAAVICNIIVCGYSYSFGLLLPPLLDHFKEDTATTAYVGSLCMSVSCLLGPVASSLCDRYGCRATTISGGITCVIGLLMTSQAPSIYCMYLTFSVIVGFGICCVYTASFVIVPRYFLKRRSLATGAITCGPAGGLLVMGPFLQFLLDTLQWRKTFIAMAGLAALICLFALIYDPLTAKEISNFEGVSNTKQPHAICERQSSWTKNIFKNPVLLIWSACPAVTYLGLYVPQVLLVKYAEQKGVPPDESAILFCYMGLTSAVARILVGHVCDFKCVKVELITQAAIYINGVAMCILSRADSYSYFLAYSLVYGFCDGLFGSTVNIQVVGSVKPHLTSKAIGFWLAVTSPSIAAGPPIAGLIVDKTGSYVPAFAVSAMYLFIGATIPFALCCLRKKKTSSIVEMQLTSDELPPERETVV